MENPQTLAPAIKCRICGCRLDAGESDDIDREVCASCRTRPEARRLGAHPAPGAPTTASKSARAFTEAERALVRKVHGYIPAQQLLAVLNERLASDLGPDAMPYTLEQLHTEIGSLGGSATSGAQGWAGLRKLLAQARRAGVLAVVNEQVINDFAVVFSLNSRQVVQLKDVVLPAKDDL